MRVMLLYNIRKYHTEIPYYRLIKTQINFTLRLSRSFTDNDVISVFILENNNFFFLLFLFCSYFSLPFLLLVFICICVLYLLMLFSFVFTAVVLIICVCVCVHMNVCCCLMTFDIDKMCLLICNWFVFGE